MPRFQVYAVVLTALMISWATLVVVTPPVSTGKRVSEDFKSIPLTIDSWHGQNGMFQGARSLYDQLRTCSLLTRHYYDTSENEVMLDIVMGLELGDFHQPEICMGGAGWKVVDTRIVTLHPVGGPPHQAVLNFMRSDANGDIVLLYWFYMGGKVSPKLGDSKIVQAFRTLFTKPAPSAMVKFTAPVGSDVKQAEKSAIALSQLLQPSIVKMMNKTPIFEDSNKVFESLPKEE